MEKLYKAIQTKADVFSWCLNVTPTSCSAILLGFFIPDLWLTLRVTLLRTYLCLDIYFLLSIFPAVFAKS